MPGTRLPLTANFHFIKSCNYGCGYCYATFADLVGRPVLPEEELFALVGLLARTYTKVTLVGGEPTLYPRLPDLLAAVKSEGALTNVVTNGSRIDPGWLQRHAGRLDLLTLSIDSADSATHRTLGRATRRGDALPVQHYLDLADAARAAGIGVKVNTVVTTINAAESLAELIRRLHPERWKVLQAAPVTGQNDAAIGALTPDRADFDAYLDRHETALAGSGIRIVPEPIEAIRGSYIMVDPQGRFFDSTAGHHTYSRPILQAGIRAAFAEVDFDPGKYHARGGDADLRNPPSGGPRPAPRDPAAPARTAGGPVLVDRRARELQQAGPANASSGASAPPILAGGATQVRARRSSAARAGLPGAGGCGAASAGRSRARQGGDDHE